MATGAITVGEACSARRAPIALFAMLFVDESIAAIAQPQGYHMLADQRAWLGMPNAADVLSSFAFLAVGALGLWRLRVPVASLPAVTRSSLIVLFSGLVLTSFGSGYYHLHPNDRTLVWDRLPMTIAFAGVYGAVVAQRIGTDAGRVVLLVMLALGPASVVYWAITAELLPYVVVHLGLFATVFALVAFMPNPRDRLSWWTLMALYVVAKLGEMADAAIWNATSGLFAGHLVKHLAAALGCLALARAIPVPRVRTGTGSPPEAASPVAR